MATTKTTTSVNYSDSNGGEPGYKQPTRSQAGGQAISKPGAAVSSSNEVNELVGQGPDPTPPPSPQRTEDVEFTANKHMRVSSPLVRETGSEASAEEATDTESAYEEGWEEKTPADTEASEEAEPVIEASWVASPSESDQEFFGFLAAALPAILPLVKPLIAKAVPAALGGISNLLSPAIKKLPASAQPTATSLLAQLRKLGLNVKLESASGDEAGDEAGEEATSEVDPETVATAQQQLETVFGPDDRIQVMNTTITPYKRICHLRILAANGKLFLGSGFFIGPRTILTAGHCVYMHSEGGWPKRIVVTPGRNAGDTAFGTFTTTKFRSVQGWVTDQDRNYDYGVIQIERSDSISQNIGAFGFGYYENAALLNKKLNNAGYPGDKPSGTLWRNGRKAISVTPTTILYDFDTYGGQSGSPVWFYRVTDGRRMVVGIHTNGGSSSNSATRITKEVYDNLVAWRTEGGLVY